MNHHSLREIAKVGSGLVLADLISVLWFSAAGLFPMSILGVTWTSQAVPEIAIFDIALLILLVHFGWNMRLPVQSPSERTLLKVAGFIFLIVSLAHLTRIAFNWSFILGDFVIPVWLSWFGVIIAGYLSYASFHFAAVRRR
jgi:hypothetical protein